jgi:hypothetical protein
LCRFGSELEQRVTRCGTRTRNPQIRSLIRYPLRQPRSKMIKTTRTNHKHNPNHTNNTQTKQPTHTANTYHPDHTHSAHIHNSPTHHTTTHPYHTHAHTRTHRTTHNARYILYENTQSPQVYTTHQHALYERVCAYHIIAYRAHNEPNDINRAAHTIAQHRASPLNHGTNSPAGRPQRMGAHSTTRQLACSTPHSPPSHSFPCSFSLSFLDHSDLLSPTGLAPRFRLLPSLCRLHPLRTPSDRRVWSRLDCFTLSL